MYHRSLSSKIRLEKDQYPVLAIIGPRQTGKTTLVREVFQDYQYVLLEDLEVRHLAISDPKGFLNRYQGSLILDEVQKVPDLLSYIQAIVDAPNNRRKFVLTGSEHLLLSDKIAQTLAGRVRIYNLLPLSMNELEVSDLHLRILSGGYPRIHDQRLDPTTWIGQYYSTYVEKDVRNVLNVKNLNDFDRVVRLCAGRIGQLIDHSGIANDSGVSAPTVRAWIDTLKLTFICFLLEPHFKNFNKRLIKSPKLYFFDTGLLCYLLRIRTIDELITHPLYGQIFENWVIAEKLKLQLHQGIEPDYYFWRDQKGNEVDLVEDRAGTLIPTEIKSSETFHTDFLKNIGYLNKLQGSSNGQVIYGGQDSFAFKDFSITSWKDLEKK